LHDAREPARPSPIFEKKLYDSPRDVRMQNEKWQSHFHGKKDLDPHPPLFILKNLI